MVIGSASFHTILSGKQTSICWVLTTVWVYFLWLRYIVKRWFTFSWSLTLYCVDSHHYIYWPELVSQQWLSRKRVAGIRAAGLTSAPSSPVLFSGEEWNIWLALQQESTKKDLLTIKCVFNALKCIQHVCVTGTRIHLKWWFGATCSLQWNAIQWTFH